MAATVENKDTAMILQTAPALYFSTGILGQSTTDVDTSVKLTDWDKWLNHIVLAGCV